MTTFNQTEHPSIERKLPYVIVGIFFFLVKMHVCGSLHLNSKAKNSH